MNIQLNQNAIKHIKTMYVQNPEKIAVFSMKTTGCSGFEYSVSLETASNQIEIIEYSGLVVGFDKGFIDKFEGCVIDYYTDRFESKFIFSNPNITSSCGCGISVSF